MPSIAQSTPVFTLLVTLGILYVLYKLVTDFFSQNATDKAADVYSALLFIVIIIASLKYFVHLNWLGFILALLGTLFVGIQIGGWLFPTSTRYGDGGDSANSAKQDQD